jgi:tRNA/tmRNA/rRNA uracil-C5-methylase (TrmA/RlmC/RlmD family)
MAAQRHRRRPSATSDTRPSTPPGPPVGTDVDLEITGVAHGGVFIARHEGRVVFVSDAIPGEHVRARVAEAKHDSFWRADTVEVLQASPHRVDHIWPSAAVDRAPENRAGGAEFGHIDLPYQRELKGAVIADALSRMAKLDDRPVVEAVGEADAQAGRGWRTRVRLQVADDGAVGPYAARTHHVVAVDDLPLATAAIRHVAPLTDRFPEAASIDVVAPSVGETLVLHNERRGGLRAPAHPIVERVGSRDFRLDARGFWQVHALAAETLTRAVQEAVDDSLFDPAAANLDLYGGVGLFAAALGDRFGRTTRITSVESAEAAGDFAAQNLADWVGAAVVTDRVERFVDRAQSDASAMERGRQRAATVVLDPPRSGAGRDVVQAIGRMSPAQVVYVACDPVAFARDAALFATDGYRVRSLRAFDLFPHTHHMELVAQFTR